MIYLTHYTENNKSYKEFEEIVILKDLNELNMFRVELETRFKAKIYFTYKTKAE